MKLWKAVVIAGISSIVANIALLEIFTPIVGAPETLGRLYRGPIIGWTAVVALRAPRTATHESSS